MCVLLILFLSGVPVIDEELDTETSLPEETSKNTDMLPSSGKMNGGVDGDRKGVCMCLTVCTLAVCKNQFLDGA